MELPKNLFGHEQRKGNHWREWEVLGGGGQRGKNWDNCNSIINKKESTNECLYSGTTATTKLMPLRFIHGFMCICCVGFFCFVHVIFVLFHCWKVVHRMTMPRFVDPHFPIKHMKRKHQPGRWEHFIISWCCKRVGINEAWGKFSLESVVGGLRCFLTPLLH